MRSFCKANSLSSFLSHFSLLERGLPALVLVCCLIIPLVSSAQQVEVYDAVISPLKGGTLAVRERFELVGSSFYGALPGEVSKGSTGNTDSTGSWSLPESEYSFIRHFDSSHYRLKDNGDAPLPLLIKKVTRNGAPVSYSLQKSDFGYALRIGSSDLALDRAPASIELIYEVSDGISKGKRSEGFLFSLHPGVGATPIRHSRVRVAFPERLALSRVGARFLEGSQAEHWQVDRRSGKVIELRQLPKDPGAIEIDETLSNNRILISWPQSVLTLSRPARLELPLKVVAKAVDTLRTIDGFRLMALLGVLSLLSIVASLAVLWWKAAFGGPRVTLLPSKNCPPMSAAGVGALVGADDEVIARAYLAEKVLQGECALVVDKDKDAAQQSVSSFVVQRKAGDGEDSLWQLLFAASSRNREQNSTESAQTSDTGWIHVGRGLENLSETLRDKALAEIPEIFSVAEHARQRQSTERLLWHGLWVVMVQTALLSVFSLILSEGFAVDMVVPRSLLGGYALTVFLTYVVFWIAMPEKRSLQVLAARDLMMKDIVQFKMYLQSAHFGFSCPDEGSYRCRMFEHQLPYAIALGLHERILESFLSSFSKVKAGYFPSWYFRSCGSKEDLSNSPEALLQLAG